MGIKKRQSTLAKTWIIEGAEKNKNTIQKSEKRNQNNH